MKTVSAEMLGSIFTQSLQEIISKVSGFSLEVVSADFDAQFEDYVAFMSLISMKGGIIFISAGELSIRTLCSYMTGTPDEEITKADLEDVLSEFVNMTAGNAKLQLNDTEFMYKLSTPLVINGRDLSIATKKNVNVVSRTLSNGDISVKLRVVY